MDYKNKYKKYKFKYNKLICGGNNVNNKLIKRNPDDECKECGITLEECGSDNNQCYSFHSDDNRLIGCYSKAGLCGSAKTSKQVGHFRLPSHPNVNSQEIIDELDCENLSQPTKDLSESISGARFHINQMVIYRGPVLGWEGKTCKIMDIRRENDSFIYDIRYFNWTTQSYDRFIVEEDRLSPIVENPISSEDDSLSLSSSSSFASPPPSSSFASSPSSTSSTSSDFSF